MKPDSLIKTILFATDFSSCANRAYQYALSMASTWGAVINVLHVVEFQPGMDPNYDVNRLYLQQMQGDTYKQMVSLAERAESLNISIEKREAIGFPSVEIKRIAREIDSDLVVLGTHGRTGLQHVLLGSTAERVIKDASCPVLAVREVENSDTASSDKLSRVAIDRILVPIDFSDCSLDALGYAAQLAPQVNARVTIFHVLEPVSYGLDFTLSHAADPDRRERIQTWLAEFSGALAASGIATDHALQGGFPAESILSFAHTKGTNLIIMGTHGRRGLSHLVSGSVTEAVLRRAHCPVLTVRSPKFGPRQPRVLPIGKGQTDRL